MPGLKAYKVTNKEKEDFFKWLYANGYTPTIDFDPVQHPAFLQWDALGRPSADVVFTQGKGGRWQVERKAPSDAGRDKRLETALGWKPPSISGTKDKRIPQGVNLTGERKFIGEDEYEKGSDGRWYKVKLTPSVGGVAPTDLIMIAPSLFYSASSGEYWFEGEGGRVKTSEEFAQSYLAESGLGRTPSVGEQQWDISRNRREWASGVNIEQDMTTGKLYRPGSMVEVSPEIATAELQSAGGGNWEQRFNESQASESKRRWDIEQRQKAGEFDREQSLLPQRMALQWELDRQRLLSGLPSDEWVIRGIVENELKFANPYKKQGGAQEIGSLVGGLGAQLDRQTGQVQALEQMWVNRLMGGDTEAAEKAKEALTEAQSARDETYQAWKTVKTEAADWSPQPPPRRQVYPNAPEWLPQYASGQVAGREITPENVITPSGQQLTAMPQSRANQLASYADWTSRMGKGRNWRDILGEAELMQPNTPRGGLSRWSPSRT